MRSKLTKGVPTLARQQRKIVTEINRSFKKHIWVTARTWCRQVDLELWGWGTDGNFDDKAAWQQWWFERIYPQSFNREQAYTALRTEVLPLLEQHQQLQWQIWQLENPEQAKNS